MIIRPWPNYPMNHVSMRITSINRFMINQTICCDTSEAATGLRQHGSWMKGLLSYELHYVTCESCKKNIKLFMKRCRQRVDLFDVVTQLQSFPPPSTDSSPPSTDSSPPSTYSSLLAFLCPRDRTARRDNTLGSCQKHTPIHNWSFNWWVSLFSVIIDNGSIFIN